MAGAQGPGLWGNPRTARYWLSGSWTLRGVVRKCHLVLGACPWQKSNRWAGQQEILPEACYSALPLVARTAVSWGWTGTGSSPGGEDWVGKLRPKSCCREKATLWSLLGRVGWGLVEGLEFSIHQREGDSEGLQSQLFGGAH